MELLNNIQRRIQDFRAMIAPPALQMDTTEPNETPSMSRADMLKELNITKEEYIAFSRAKRGIPGASKEPNIEHRILPNTLSDFLNKVKQYNKEMRKEHGNVFKYQDVTEHKLKAVEAITSDDFVGAASLLYQA